MSEANLSLGIDIGGTRIKAVATQTDGTLVDQRVEGSVSNVPALIEIVTELVNSFDLGEVPLGISAPGIASRDNRSIAWMRGRMQAVEGLKWCEHLGRDVWVLNDAHAATLAEACIGAARGHSNVLLLTLGTGVGGGVILNGQLLQGATGRAGHLGHIALDQNASPDIVGIPGSLEDCIGNHNIYERSGHRFSSTTKLLEAMQAGDAQARECWEKSVRGLAVGIASLVNCFDPELVVLGGGVSVAQSLLFDPLQQYLDRFEWRPHGVGVPVVPAKLGELAGAIGAARFAALRFVEKSL
ncbi:MAG: ROK family protein [Bythopirellula sp.]|nr:ROK family protein [Bythopirellula sp.]